MFLLDMDPVGACSTFTGNGGGFPGEIANIISIVYNFIKIGVPLLLIIFGMLDLGKAVIAQKEDEIKKGQQLFIRRLIAAVIVFFVLFIVQFVIGLVDSDGVMSCVSGILNYQS